MDQHKGKEGEGALLSRELEWGLFNLGAHGARSSLGTGARLGSECWRPWQGGWGHMAAAPAGPHGQLGCPSVLKSVYFKGYKVLGCCRVTGALAEPLIKVSRGCRRGEEEEGGWQRLGTVPPPRARTPLELAPMRQEPSVRSGATPQPDPIVLQRRRPAVGTAICLSLPAASLFAARRTLAQEAAPHVLRPFPLAEAPNEIKDLLQRGGGKGKQAEQFENVAPGPGAGLFGWVQAGPGSLTWPGCSSEQHEAGGWRGGSRAWAGGWCMDLGV